MLGIIALSLGAGAAPAQGQRTFLMVVAGLGGDPEYSDSFYEAAIALADGAMAAGVPEEQIRVLTEDPDRAPARIGERSTRENVLAGLSELTGEVQEADQLWIVLIGHGSASAEANRFNLPGPDITESDFAAALDGVDGTIAFVNAASASGGFVGALSGERRAIVTATRSGGQRNETVFGSYFANAFVDGTGDTDKNGRVSLMEAFEYASAEVERYYESESLLRTEHPQLDDNGDREASTTPDPLAVDGSVDGRLASRLYLGQEEAASLAADDPAVAALLGEKAELESRIESLRLQRESLDEDTYLDELEALMVALAKTQRELDAATARGGDRE